MAWLYWILIMIVILASSLVGIALSIAIYSENPVGFQVGITTDSNGQSFPIGIWYPTQARPYPTTLIGPVLMSVARDAPITGSNLPLVVISHGNGGGIQSHADLALALANAGFIVAVPQHTGDNFSDQSAFGSEFWLSRRNDEFRTTIDYMLKDWAGHDHIDPKHIGAFGFSAGGFTVLTSIGARPNLHMIAKHCSETPEFVCDLLQQVKSPLLEENLSTINTTFLPDPRIKVAVVAAPGLVFTMTPSGLKDIQVPVQLWYGDKDNKVPYATNIQPILDALETRVEFHLVAGAEHFSFLTPCGLPMPSEICREQGQFDRKSFHTDMNKSIITFFEINMEAP